MSIICGDCLDVMRSMEDNSIDTIITSPPYDNLRTCYDSDFDFEEIAKQIFRIMKQGGVLVWVVADSTIAGSETGTSFKQALYFKEKCGFNIHDTMIYEKVAISFPDSTRYYNSFEYMFVFSKGRPKHINLIKDRENISFGRKIHGKSRTADGNFRKMSGEGKDIKEIGVRWNIWRIANQSNSVDRNGHPAAFPLQLALDHIKTWNPPDGLVLDPFAGSGTTILAAKLLGFDAIGIEKSEEYSEIARKRLGNHERDFFVQQAQGM